MKPHRSSYIGPLPSFAALLACGGRRGRGRGGLRQGSDCGSCEALRASSPCAAQRDAAAAMPPAPALNGPAHRDFSPVRRAHAHRTARTALRCSGSPQSRPGAGHPVLAVGTAVACGHSNARRQPTVAARTRAAALARVGGEPEQRRGAGAVGGAAAPPTGEKSLWARPVQGREPEASQPPRAASSAGGRGAQRLAGAEVVRQGRCPRPCRSGLRPQAAWRRTATGQKRAEITSAPSLFAALLRRSPAAPRCS